MGSAPTGQTGPTVDEQAAAETLADSVGAYSAEQYEQHVEPPVAKGNGTHPGGFTHDEHGVPFDMDYCGKAADPFYKSGPNRGQWKKRQGVDQSAYDLWYVASTPALENDAPNETAPPASQASHAFAASQPQQQQQPPQTAPGASQPPADGGEFMKWQSSQQAAGEPNSGRRDASVRANRVRLKCVVRRSGPACNRGAFCGP